MTTWNHGAVRPSVSPGELLALLATAVALAIVLYALLEAAGGWR